MLRAVGAFSIAGLAGFSGAILIHGDSGPGHRHNGDLRNHPYVQRLQTQGYKVSRTIADRAPAYHLRHMVTSNLLAGPDKVEPLPISLANDQGEEQTVYHLGEKLAGTPILPRHSWFQRIKSALYLSDAKPVVHSGAAITILDEGLARAAFPQLPNGLGLTAILNVYPLRDITPDSYVVLKARPIEATGRKARAAGSLYVLNGDKLGAELVRGDVMMVEPSWAKTTAGFLKLLLL